MTYLIDAWLDRPHPYLRILNRETGEVCAVLEEEALNLGYRKLILHARDYALPFYERLGYTIVGPSYKLFDVLQHFEMFKILS